jgi:hypothetical protein
LQKFILIFAEFELPPDLLLKPNDLWLGQRGRLPIRKQQGMGSWQQVHSLQAVPVLN